MTTFRKTVSTLFALLILIPALGTVAVELQPSERRLIGALFNSNSHICRNLAVDPIVIAVNIVVPLGTDG